MMDSRRLWAKSKRYGEASHPSMLLSCHLADVYKAAEQLLNATGDDQLHALGLAGSQYRDRLRRCVLLAAAVHDLGKANDHFQGMVCGTRNVFQRPQGIRHEWVTVLILRQLRDWLLPALEGNGTDFAIVDWAVAGHHPAHDHASPPKAPPEVAGPELSLYCGHADFLESLDWLKVEFSLSQVMPLANQSLDLGTNGQVFPIIMAWDKAARKTWDRLSRDERRLVAAVKNCLIAADVAGSALPKAAPHDLLRWNWIATSFSDRPKSGELQTIVDHRLNGHLPRDFQTLVADSLAPVTFVKAGCGSGKTLAAYMWAAKNHPTRRLYFCYPTTGTATEGFRDYLFEPDVNADLFHSRRDVDFEIIFNTGPDSQNPESDDAIRIDSLDTWSTPIVSCTVDTVLGIMQNNRRGMYAWPALAQSAFVFDEIHAYDDRLFGSLLRFLAELPGLPSLLMTASLPRAREEALRTLLKDRRHIDLVPIAGPAELEKLPRYKKGTLEDDNPLPFIRETLRNGHKVLWVCNTVARVMDAADRLSDCSPLVYHSRFKYEDRVRRHKAVIDAFKDTGPALAICSQVAEMSLDLSADLLVTDLAKVPALIQRLGRLNRRASPDTPIPPKPFIVVQPNIHLPYTDDDLVAARVWIGKLPDDGISQQHLANAWEQSGVEEVDLGTSTWIDGGPTTSVVELREPSLGITVLMQEDLPRAKSSRKELGKLTLPMGPTKLPWQTWPHERGLPIAPVGAISYEPGRGAEWRK